MNEATQVRRRTQKRYSKEKEEGTEQEYRQTSDGLDVKVSCTAGAGPCWGRIAGSGGITARRGGTHGLSFESVEGVTGGGGIYGKYHSTGTVATLSAINPHWGSAIHGNGESREGGCIGTNGVAERKIRQKGHCFCKSITYNPELKPFAMGLQGLAKVDWVAVWFF